MGTAIVQTLTNFADLEHKSEHSLYNKPHSKLRNNGEEWKSTPNVATRRDALRPYVHLIQPLKLILGTLPSTVIMTGDLSSCLPFYFCSQWRAQFKAIWLRISSVIIFVYGKEIVRWSKSNMAHCVIYGRLSTWLDNNSDFLFFWFIIRKSLSRFCDQRHTQSRYIWWTLRYQQAELCSWFDAVL